MHFIPKATLALALLTSASLAVLPAHAQGPNIVTNPGFETGDFTGWTTFPATKGSQFSVFNGSAHTGNYAALFASGGGLDDSISQALPTTIGDNYTITFWLFNHGDGDIGSEFQASFGTTQLLELQGDPTSPYQQYTFTETATAKSTPLTFAGRTPPGYFVLDDISVNDLGPAAVPETSTTVSLGLLLCFGLGAVTWSARRRKALSAE